MEAEQKKILKPLVLTLRHLLEGRYDEHGSWHGGDLEARMSGGTAILSLPTRRHTNQKMTGTPAR